MPIMLPYKLSHVWKNRAQGVMELKFLQAFGNTGLQQNELIVP
jgi:hypothetical protein